MVNNKLDPVTNPGKLTLKNINVDGVKTADYAIFIEYAIVIELDTITFTNSDFFLGFILGFIFAYIIYQL